MPSPATPDADVVTYLAAQLGTVAGVAWASGTNLFRGPVRAPSDDLSSGGVPNFAIFVLSSAGPAPEKFIGGASAGSLYLGRVQVRVRGNPGEFDNPQLVARTVRDTLHRAAIAGYVYFAAVDSEPVYIGADDNRCEEFALNFDLWRTATP